MDDSTSSGRSEEPARPGADGLPQYIVTTTDVQQTGDPLEQILELPFAPGLVWLVLAIAGVIGSSIFFVLAWGGGCSQWLGVAFHSVVAPGLLAFGICYARPAWGWFIWSGYPAASAFSCLSCMGTTDMTTFLVLSCAGMLMASLVGTAVGCALGPRIEEVERPVQEVVHRYCPECRYDLRGSGLRGCPECGWKRKDASKADD